jgi:hypothetical protein
MMGYFVNVVLFKWLVLLFPFVLLELTRGVSHCGLVIYIKKYLEAKGKLWKLEYFTMQKYNLQNILKETKIFQDIITL